MLRELEVFDVEEDDDDEDDGGLTVCGEDGSVSSPIPKEDIPSTISDGIPERYDRTMSP